MARLERELRAWLALHDLVAALPRMRPISPRRGASRSTRWASSATTPSWTRRALTPADARGFPLSPGAWLAAGPAPERSVATTKLSKPASSVGARGSAPVAMSSRRPGSRRRSPLARRTARWRARGVRAGTRARVAASATGVSISRTHQADVPWLAGNGDTPKRHPHDGQTGPRAINAELSSGRGPARRLRPPTAPRSTCARGRRGPRCRRRPDEAGRIAVELR